MKRSIRSPRNAGHVTFVPPYPPSWFDRLKTWAEAAPGPFWLPYGLTALVSVGLLQAAHTLTGGAGAMSPVFLLVAGLAFLTLGFVHGLDRLALRSFDAFHPVLDATEAEGRVLRYSLTTLPARPTALAAGGLVLVGLVVVSSQLLPATGVAATSIIRRFADEASQSPLATAFTSALLLFSWWSMGTVVYHTIHQLGWVSRIYADHTRINLLKPAHIYTLSRLTITTAVVTLLIPYVWLLVEPRFFEDRLNIFGALALTGIAAATFILPLLGIHRRLTAEKHRLLSESSDRLESALAELHRRVDQGRLSRVDELNKTLASLEMERNLLSRIPTWPWQPETLRTLVAALLLPLVLWAAQALLAKWLGP